MKDLIDITDLTLKQEAELIDITKDICDIKFIIEISCKVCVSNIDIMYRLIEHKKHSSLFLQWYPPTSILNGIKNKVKLSIWNNSFAIILINKHIINILPFNKITSNAYK